MKTITTYKKQANKFVFARTLGRKPLRGSTMTRTATGAVFMADLQLLVETFGPAEQKRLGKSRMAYWNFERIDGAIGFSLYATIPNETPSGELEIQLVARKAARSFLDWTACRIGAVENGDEFPLFLGADRFAISRMN